MGNAFESTGNPLTTEDLANVEEQIGVTLPSSMRAHYLQFNGGRPEKNIFVDAGFEFDVHQFHKMRDVFEKRYETVVLQKKLIPRQLIPFAMNQGGDFFCMDKDTEEIFFYDMDHCLQPARAARKIAPSLTYFLEHMVTEDELYDEEEDE